MSQNLHLISSHKKILSLYNSDAVFCAFDTEATGIDVKKENLIEIGAIKFTKDKILGKFEFLVNPQKEIPEFIQELTHITNDDVKNCPTTDLIIPQFRKFVQDTILVAHNAQFDLRLINIESERLGLLPLKNEAIDSLRMSRILLPDNTSWKLSSLAQQFSINVKSSHRAFDDARVCSELFKNLVTLPIPKKHKRRKIQTLQESDKQLPLF